MPHYPIPGYDEALLKSALAYVQGRFVPPLPPAYAPWLVDLARLAETGARPDAVVPVPPEVASHRLPRGAYTDGSGTRVITLWDALAALRKTDLLLDRDEDEEAGGVVLPKGVELMEPVTALALANTADAATVVRTHSASRVSALADGLRGGRWEIHPDRPVQIDQQGRVVEGLDSLLAIVEADVCAPVAMAYGTDNVSGGYSWRSPLTADSAVRFETVRAGRQPLEGPHVTEAVMPHYMDDPLMEVERRRRHGLELTAQPALSQTAGYAVFTAFCRCGGWSSGRPYDGQAHAELFDQHMGEVQRQVHAQADATFSPATPAND